MKSSICYRIFLEQMRIFASVNNRDVRCIVFSIRFSTCLTNVMIREVMINENHMMFLPIKKSFNCDDEKVSSFTK